MVAIKPNLMVPNQFKNLTQFSLWIPWNLTLYIWIFWVEISLIWILECWNCGTRGAWRNQLPVCVLWLCLPAWLPTGTLRSAFLVAFFTNYAAVPFQNLSISGLWSNGAEAIATDAKFKLQVATLQDSIVDAEVRNIPVNDSLVDYVNNYV